MAAGHAGATGAAEGLLQVHVGPLKELPHLVGGQHHTILVNKLVERHASGAGDVTWFDSCEAKTEETLKQRGPTQTGLVHIEQLWLLHIISIFNWLEVVGSVIQAPIRTEDHLTLTK